jgi:hypothetical protein
VWTDAEGLSTPAGLVPGTVVVRQKPKPRFSFMPAAAGVIGVDAATGNRIGPPTVVSVNLAEDPDGLGAPNAVTAFSTSFANDPGALLLTDVNAGAALAALNGGAGPELLDWGTGDACVYVTCVISLTTPSEHLTALPSAAILDLVFDVPAGVYLGAADDVLIELPFLPVCGAAPVATEVAIDGGVASVYALEEHPIAVTVKPGLRNPFIRGDANVDGRLDLGDPIWLIDELFRDGPIGACRLAKDANGDADADVSDVVYLIGYLFREEQAPPEPFPSCGIVVDQDEDDCLSYPPCAE